jgi:hypothetical protein
MKKFSLSNLIPLWLKGWVNSFFKKPKPINTPALSVDEEYLKRLIDSTRVPDYYDEDNY